MVDAPAFRLHLAPELDSLYLDVPVDAVASLCLHPVKYLRFLAYCILGVDGTIAMEDFEGEVLPDEDRLGEGVYCFVREGEGDVLEHAVDPEALTYSHVFETTNTRDNFRTLVAERDVVCIFTNMHEESCQGIHVVPFNKGDAWMKHIVENRIPEEKEDVSNLTTINEIRNGMLVSNDLHPLIDKRKLVVLKTPNRVLACNDIPPRSNNNPDLLGDDAAFKKHSKKPKPSPLLLNYNYGVAALKWWGKGPEYLLTARKRPAPPIAATLGSLRSKVNRSHKLAGLQGGSGGNGEVEDIDERRQSEAERLVDARKQQAERQDRMAEWQNGVRMALDVN
ncbi:hypothetical protein B0H14DRAFT_3538832 [Mycena olivaceomarginata]|nr:hypothetical protein B0H14DRAFT_3538832 [Mycena olivaceomarginata]